MSASKYVALTVALICGYTIYEINQPPVVVKVIADDVKFQSASFEVETDAEDEVDSK